MGHQGLKHVLEQGLIQHAGGHPGAGYLALGCLQGPGVAVAQSQAAAQAPARGVIGEPFACVPVRELLEFAP